jgi:DNA-directed RNA polymerase specialized sigma24 family protein
VERFRVPVARFAAKIGVSPSDVEDVTQETLLAFAQAFREGQFTSGAVTRISG